MSGSTLLAMSISVVSWKLAVSASRLPNVATAQLTISCGDEPASSSFASATSAGPSTARRRSATGATAAVAVPGGSRSMLIGLKSDQFTLVSATLPEWPGDLQEITDQICQDLP